MRLARDGRAVAYMGDDERFDYLYKFVFKQRMRRGRGWTDRRHNLALLSEGDLYVAQFSGDSPAAEIVPGTGALPADGAFDGSGTWIPLVRDGVSMVAGMTVEEVLVYTRLAADKVGATKMDRLRGRAAVAEDRQGVRGVHEQHRPRQVRQGRPDGAESAQREQGWAHRRDHRAVLRRGGHHVRLEPAAGLRRSREANGRVPHLLRGLPGGEGVADRLPRQCLVRQRRRLVDRHGRATVRDRLLGRPVQGSADRAGAWPRPAVPRGAYWSGNVRAGGARR